MFSSLGGRGVREARASAQPAEAFASTEGLALTPQPDKTRSQRCHVAGRPATRPHASEGRSHDSHRRHYRPRNPRQPRQSDRRSRCAARGRLRRKRRRSLRCLDGSPRGKRTPRRRQGALSGQGCAEGRRGRQRRDLRCAFRHGCRGPAPHRCGADQARRHAEQEPTGSQCNPGRFAGRGEGRGGIQQSAALPLCRRRQRASAARADDEHHQRRRPRRQPYRHPGIHDHAGRGRPARTRSAWAPRCSTR